MTRSIFIILFIFLSTLTFAQPQWLKGYGNESNNYFAGMDVDPNGNIYFAGSFSDSITFDGITALGGEYSLFIAKFNSAGEILWLKSETSEARYYIYDLKLTNEGGFVINGSFDTGDAEFGDIVLTYSGLGNTYLTKYDASGNAIWAITEIGFAVYENISIDSNNDIIVYGLLLGDFTFNGELQETFGEYDIVYAKYASTGEPLWVKTMGGIGNEYPASIITDADNNIIMTGRYDSPFVYEAFLFSNYGLGDNFVMKTDANGNPVWVNLIGSESDDSAIEGIGIGADSNLYLGVTVFNDTYVEAITIATLGLSDACLMQLNPENGTVNWYKTGGGYEYDYVNALKVAKEGILLGGTYSGTAEFNGLQLPEAFSSGYVTTYDYNGDATSVKAFFGENFIRVQALDIDAHGNFYVGGHFNDDIACDGLETVSSNGGTDIFLYKETSSLVNIDTYNENFQIELAPNPASSYINVTAGFDDLFNVNIINQQGAIIMSITKVAGFCAIDVENIAAGMYFIVATTESGTITSHSFVKN